MSTGFHVVVCGGPVPDPLQALEPVETPAGPALKNEGMLPAVLDPWAAHALYEAAHLAAHDPDSKVWLVSLGPKARLQQLMMSIAQKARFELVALDGPSGGFIEAAGVGGCASASRDAGVTLQMTGERLGIGDQFLGVDRLTVEDGGAFTVLERIEGGRYRVSRCDGPPAVLGWATGSLPEPPNNPQLGMQNMRTVMPALQKAQAAPLGTGDVTFARVELPPARRQTRIVKDQPVDAIAREIVDWIRKG
jgi:electron transfer flavoprotein beta subunit